MRGVPKQVKFVLINFMKRDNDKDIATGIDDKMEREDEIKQRAIEGKGQKRGRIIETTKSLKTENERQKRRRVEK